MEETAAKATATSGFKGMQVVVGCCIQLLVAIGFTCAYVAAYGLIPEQYGLDMATIGVCVSANGVAGFIGFMVANTVVKKIGLRNSLLFAVVDILVYGAFAAFGPGAIGLGIAMFLGGFITAFSGATLTNEIVAKWYVEKRAQMLGITMAALSFGLAAFNAIGGIVFSIMPVRTGFIVLAVGSAAVLLINDFTLLRHLDPAEVGQYPDGKSEPPAAPEMPEAVETGAGAEPVAAHESVPAGSIYKKLGFWLLIIISAINGVTVSYVYQYCTAYMTAGGIDYGVAATVLTLMGTASGLIMLVSGNLYAKLGTRLYLIATYAIAILCNVLAIVFLSMPSMAVVVGIVITYMLGYPACTASTFVIYEVGKPESCLNLISKTSAALMAFNVVIAPSFGTLVDTVGYAAVFIVEIVACAIAFISYQVLLGGVKRNGQL